MKSICRTFRFFVASGIITSLLLPSFALAQEGIASSIAPSAVPVSQEGGIPVRNDFQVSPTRFTMELEPGEEQTVQISLLSRSDDEYTYSITAEDFGADEEEDIRLFGGQDGPFSARRWAKTPITSLKLSHGEHATIPVTVTVPANAAAGDHYVAVLFQRDPKEGPQAGFNIIARVGVLFLITVKGPAVKKGHLETFKSLLPVYWWLPAEFSLQYRNEGTVHLVPQGSVQIKNIFGITVDDIPVRDWYVLRASARNRLITWKPHFALGYYKATVKVKTEANPESEEISVAFWVVPVIPVSIGLIAIFLVSFIVQMFFSRFEIRTKKKK